MSFITFHCFSYIFLELDAYEWIWIDMGMDNWLSGYLDIWISGYMDIEDLEDLIICLVALMDFGLCPDLWLG